MEGPTYFIFASSLVIDRRLDLLPVRKGRGGSPFLLLSGRKGIVSDVPSLLPIVPIAAGMMQLGVLGDRGTQRLCNGVKIRNVVATCFGGSSTVRSPQILSAL